MKLKEQIIEIIGFGMEPKRAECKAQEIIDLINDDEPVITNETEYRIVFIRRVVCKYYDVLIRNIMTKSRKKEIVSCRQIIHYFCNKLTKASYNRIGEMVGNKDHATVMHSIKKVTGFIETDRKYRNQIAEIEALIKKALTPGNVVEQKPPEKTTETAQISINEVEQYKVLAEDRLIKINALQQRNNLYQKIIKELNFKLRIAEGQARLYKKVQSYDNIPAMILRGE